MTTNEILAHRIKQRRTDMGMTMTDLAKAVGVNQSSIQRYESGRFGKIKLPVVESIARALGCDPAWLCGKNDDPQPLIGPVTITDAREPILLDKFRQLNDSGKVKLVNYADDLLQIDQYRDAKAPLTIAARGGKVIDVSKVDGDALDEALKGIDPIDSL